MTSREKIDFTEKKICIHSERGGYCENCGELISVEKAQLAHRIPKTKGNLKKYGKEIIHHELNLAVTCSLECNSMALVHGIEIQRLANEIEAAFCDQVRYQRDQAPRLREVPVD